MTKTLQLPASPKPIRVTRQQATVWHYIRGDWLTVAEIYDRAYLNLTEDWDSNIALNTVKNAVKWLVGLGVVEQAPHLTPARYREMPHDSHGRTDLVQKTIDDLNEAVRLYQDMP